MSHAFRRGEAIAPRPRELCADRSAARRSFRGMNGNLEHTARKRYPFAAVAAIEPLPDLSLPAHFTNDKIDRRFDVFKRDGKLYESEYALAPDSSEIFRDTRPMEWLIGAGVNGFGPVVE